MTNNLGKILQRFGGIGANTFWLTLEQICAAASGMILTVVAARLYGPEILGNLAFAMGFVGLFLPIVSFGLQPIIVREISKQSQSDSQIISASLILTITMSLIALCLIALLITVVTDRQEVRILAIILGLRVFLSLSNVLSAWHQAHLKSRIFAKMRIVGLIFGSCLYIFCALLKLSIYIMAAAVTLEAMAVIGMALFISFGKVTSLRLNKVPLSNLRKLMNYALPIAISSVAITLYHRSDQVMLGMMSSQMETGLYAVSSRLYGAAILIPAALAASAFPAMVRQIKASRAEIFAREFQWFFDICVLSSMAISLVTVLAAPLIVYILFGSEFSQSVPILQIHAISVIFVAVATTRDRFLYSINMQSFAMIATIFGAIINIGLNYFLIPVYGGIGAAGATLAAQLITGYVFCLLRPQLFPLFRSLTLALLIPLRVFSPQTRSSLLRHTRSTPEMKEPVSD